MTTPEAGLVKCFTCLRILPATTDNFSRSGQGLRGECRACRAEYQRRRRSCPAIRLVQAMYMRRRRADGLENIEDRRRWCRESYQRNIESHRERDRVRSKEPERRDAIREAVRKWRRDHPDEKKAESRRDYERHRKQRRDAHDEWTREHPEQVAAYHRARRARKKGVGGGHTGADVLAQVKRQHGRCFWCADKVGSDYHVDHVVPLVLGGSNGPENIVVACPSCNMHKNAAHPMDFAGVMF